MVFFHAGVQDQIISGQLVNAQVVREHRRQILSWEFLPPLNNLGQTRDLKGTLCALRKPSHRNQKNKETFQITQTLFF